MPGMTRISRTVLCLTTAALVFLLVLTVLVNHSVQAQSYTYNKVYDFSGKLDGYMLEAGVTMDGSGNLYGTAYSGGKYNWGTVYKLRNRMGAWSFALLYSFTGGNDGGEPAARVVFGPDGSLYGTTILGGSDYGTVFNLKPPPTPPPTVFAPWVDTVVYRFQGKPDGANPGFGALVFDASGAMYGTTENGGLQDQGTVYKLTPSGQGYTESVLYSFTGGSDGYFPVGAVAFDRLGNLYTTTFYGGTNGDGAVIELMPSGGGWVAKTIHSFAGATDGARPFSGVIVDSSGNLYGTTPTGGANGGGTVYELTPSGGSWTFQVLYAFGGRTDGGPLGSLVMDTVGNIYGTTHGDGHYRWGNVFKLSPSGGGGWTYADVYDFFCLGSPCSDGEGPVGELILDVDGNLYGTTSLGGVYGGGVVFKLAPQN